MKSDSISAIKTKIMEDQQNKEKTLLGILPLFSATPNSKIIIIGQAPGIRAETTQLTWNDASGDRLRQWLGVTREQFYNTDLFAQMPMDFYYPGKAKFGDLPPRKDFASKWHPQILACIKQPKLILLVGSYSQNHYLPDKLPLTERVQNYQNYLPQYFVLPHPSPLNFNWRKQNPWFEHQVVPALQKLVQQIISQK